MGILLFIIALFPTAFLTPLGALYSLGYYLFTGKWTTGLKAFDEYFYNMALSIDQFANTNLHPLLNIVMVTKVSRKKGTNYVFGDADDTLSYCIAENFYNKNLSKFGMFWAKFLNFVDSKEGGHLFKTMCIKEQRDFEAYLRHKKRIKEKNFYNKEFLR